MYHWVSVAGFEIHCLYQAAWREKQKWNQILHSSITARNTGWWPQFFLPCGCGCESQSENTGDGEIHPKPSLRGKQQSPLSFQYALWKEPRERADPWSPHSSSVLVKALRVPFQAFFTDALLSLIQTVGLYHSSIPPRLSFFSKHEVL